MQKRCQKRRIFVLFFVFLTGFFPSAAPADTFYGDLPTGLLELQDYKYPVYLYVPTNYQPDRDYPLLISVPGEGESPEKNIEFWVGLAKRQSMLVLVPTNIWPQDTPDRVDKWLIRVKEDVRNRYRISPVKTYLIGKEGGAHYAAYLGVQYPEEFSAVAALGGSWVGKFDKLIRLQSKARKQLPFFIAFKPEQGDLRERTEERAYEFEKKGYPVYLQTLEEGQDFSSDSFKRQMVKWLEEKSSAWRDAVEESKKPLKEKFILAVEEFFKV